MDDGAKESIVDLYVVVERVDEREERVLFYLRHFIFTLIDGAGDAVGLVVVHGIADGEATHKVADAGFVATLVFSYDQMEVVGEKEESMERDRGGAKLGGVAFGNDGLGS